MDCCVKSRNNSVDVFRIICAFLIVAIHTSLFMDMNTVLGNFVCNGIARIAVPFFFIVSGFFSINKMLKGQFDFKKTIKKLLLVYLFWFFIYLFKNLIFAFINGDDWVLIIKDVLFNFFVNGSEYHLWFFPALIFATIITYMAFYFNKLKFLVWLSLPLFLIGLLGGSYYNIGVNIPLISNLIQNQYFDLLYFRFLALGLSFYTLGYFVQKVNEKINFSILHVIVAFVLFVLEYVMIYKLHLSINTYSIFMIYPLVLVIFCYLLNHPWSKYDNIGSLCRNLSSFIYYVHPLNILLLSYLISVNSVISFILVIVLSIIEGLLLMKIKSKRIKGLIFG